MAYANNLQTSPTGFTPYFTSGHVFSTGALANGGAWYDASNPSGLHTTGSFLVGIATSSTSLTGTFLVEGDLSSITFSDVEAEGSFIGEFDLRGTGAGYSGFGGAAGSQPLSPSTDYHYALYREVTGAAGLSTLTTGKVGIGNDFANGYYTGTVTTDDTIIDFATTFDTGTQSGSGMRAGKDLTLSMGFVDRGGLGASSTQEFANNPYFANLDIDIGTVPSSPVTIVKTLREGYLNTELKFSEEENRSTKFPGEVDGAFTDNYTIRTRLTDVDGGVSTGDFVIYGTPKPEPLKTVVQDASGTFRNSNSSNFVSPHPTAPNAQYLTSRQQLDSLGISGTILVGVNLPEKTAYERIDLYGNRTQGNDFPLNPANFLSSYNISAGQTFLEIFQKVGVASSIPYYYALVPYSRDGKAGATHRMGPFTLGEVPVGRDPVLYKNVPNQHVKGCFTTYDCFIVQTKDDDESTLSIKDSAGVTNATLSNADGRGQLDLFDTGGTEKVSIKTDTNDEGIMSIKDSSGVVKTKVQANKSVISAAYSNIYSTGSVIIGGSNHIVSGDYDVIAGGLNNDISGCDFTFIGGGSGVCVNNSQYASTVGGLNNDIVTGDYCIIAGGKNNLISGDNSVQDRYNFIGGGLSNKITGVASAAIMGGENNEIRGVNSFIGGGNSNTVYGAYAFIGGGESNTARGEFGAILAGEDNSADGTHAVVAGGNDNFASGHYAFIGGGQSNKASGDYSYAFGRRAEITLNHTGAAVLADGQNRTHSSSGAHSLTLDFASGVYVNDLHVKGDITSAPSSSVAPPDNGDLVIEATNNTTLTFKLRGTDGTVREGTLSLS